jgi:hypothetical protein
MRLAKTQSVVTDKQKTQSVVTDKQKTQSVVTDKQFKKNNNYDFICKN